jgi:di/tricarboxylate transporter
MTFDMWLTLGILAAAVIFFITEWLRVDVVALGVVVVLMLTRLLTSEEALAGFSNPAVLTIAALFMVGGAVLQTGLAGVIGERILAVAGTSPTRLTVVVMLTVALLSGFMSDTGTVAVLLPATISLARSAKMSPTKLLIPLSFGALLGGAGTLIGTPPNIIVSDILRESGLGPFRFFDYTPLGLILLAVGIGYMLLVGRRLLPDYQPGLDLQRVETPEELIDLYRLPANLFRLRVRRNSGLIGKTLSEIGLRRDYNLTALEISRPAAPREVARLGDRRLVLQADEPESLTPTAETPLQRGDILLVQGASNDVSHAAAVWELGVQLAEAEDEDALINTEVGLAEVLLPPRSSLNGKTLVDVRFGSTYNLTVLGIRRPGADEALDLKTTVLRFGDTLLVQGAWQNIIALRRKRRDFVVMGEPEVMLGARARARAPLALLVLAGMLVLMVTNAFPLATVSLLAALAMILLGALTIDEAYEAIDWKSIVLIAGMLPMATAMEKVGLVARVADALTVGLGDLGPLAIIAILFGLTSLFTQVFSNTATTVLIAPIALATARELGLQPQAFLMAVAVAASMAFASPVASPVNTLVMGAGGYRFRDFLRVGLPLILLTLVLSVLVLPMLWPLNP